MGPLAQGPKAMDNLEHIRVTIPHAGGLWATRPHMPQMLPHAAA